METLITIFGWNFAVVFAMMICGWFISLLFKNVTIVDSLWSLGFVLITWVTFTMADGFIGRKLLIALLVSLWGLRLAVHLSWRNWGIGEDPRYGTWREKSGDRFWLVSLYKVFIVQAVFMWVISLSLQFGQLSPTPETYTWLDILGAVVWAAGFLFESVNLLATGSWPNLKQTRKIKAK
jgi:steroid 5-alpha reductase family enzyme